MVDIATLLLCRIPRWFKPLWGFEKACSGFPSYSAYLLIINHGWPLERWYRGVCCNISWAQEGRRECCFGEALWHRDTPRAGRRALWRIGVPLWARDGDIAASARHDSIEHLPWVDNCINICFNDLFDVCLVIAFVELAERFSYYGSGIVFVSSLQCTVRTTPDYLEDQLYSVPFATRVADGCWGTWRPIWSTWDATTCLYWFNDILSVLVGYFLCTHTIYPQAL